jgi:hypothetical protein
VNIDPVTIGTAIVAYIEPAPGQERAFNAWYERDHFYAAAMAGPGTYAGGRWVATRACKEVRPDSSNWGDPARGSYLATYWLLPGMQTEWETWVAAQMATLGDDRMFTGREHLHTAVYRALWDARVDDAPPPATALDHPFAGIIAIASTGDARPWVREVIGPDLPLVVGLARERVLLAASDPGDHTLLLGFCAGDPLRVWERVADALEQLAGVGFASPFLRTIPGTDTYVDEL